MRRSAVLTFAFLLTALGGCSPRAGTRASGSDPAYGLESYCVIASTPGLLDWTGGALVACPGLVPGEGEEVGDTSACTVSSVGGNGAAQATDITGAQAAQRLIDGRLLVWGFDGSLTIHGGTVTTTVADVALDPWLDASRNRIVYIAPAAGSTSLEPGDDRRVVVYDVGRQTELEVLADATASSPVGIPGTDDVLYVSSSTGVAAVFRATASVASADPTPDPCEGGRVGDPSDPSSECTPPDSTNAFVQVTNATPEIPQTLVPAFGRQHVFVGEGDTLRLVFAAPTTIEDGTTRSEIWTLDPRTGDAQDLGPGSFPQHGPSGSVLARTGEDSCVAVQYLAPGATP